jgi:large subunit ribosomal protein L22
MGLLLREQWIKPNMSTQTVKAKASFVRFSPRKLRLVVDAVRGLSPTDAVNRLKLVPKRAAAPVLAVFAQALANAKNNFKLSPGDMRVVSLQVNEGPRGPKKMDKSHGARYDRGVKRRKFAHILLEIAAEGGK